MRDILNHLVDIVIPAHNEQDTISGVVLAAADARKHRKIFVIADDCTDQTVTNAARAGAEVIEVNWHNKGSAMATGLDYVQTSHVCFLDGDLHGLTGEHVASLINPRNAHVIGLRDGAIKKWSYGLPLPKIAGERTLPTEVARNAGLFGSGYQAEMRINLETSKAHLPTLYVLMHGCDHRQMDDKWGFKQSIKPDLDRWLRVGTGTIRYLSRIRSGQRSTPTAPNS